MTTRYQVVGTVGRRSAAVSPVARPDLRLLQRHPARRPAAGRVGRVSSCAPVAPQRAHSPWLAVKLAAVSLLTVVGGAVSVSQLTAGAMTPSPAVEFVAGDPAWAHVTQP